MVFLKRNLQSSNRLPWTCHLICKQLLIIFCVGLSLKHPAVTAQPGTVAPAVDGDVRLSGGRNPLEGRVEVYFKGEWGTICDDDWGIQDADVVCRQLGYNMAARLGCCLSFGPGTGPIHVDNLACRGDEHSMEECPFNGWGRHNCGHWEDAGVVCTNPIRLKEGLTPLDGRVEVYMNGNWGTICNTNWGIEDSLVVCRMLGGYTANNYTQTVIPGTGAVHLDRVQCNGTEIVLDQCQKDAEVEISCLDHTQDVGVNCSRHIRLANGNHPLEGRLEVFNHDQWGTVCDDRFSASEAEVVCRHLGNYVPDPSKSYSCCARFGEGKGPVQMTQLVCTGSEKKIEDCQFQRRNHNCPHTEDISVHCSDLRLSDDYSSLQGKLEYIENHEWGEICSDDWDINDANVACQQLYNTTATSIYFRDSRTSVQPLFGGFQCNGTESRLSACPRSTYDICTSRHVAGIKCKGLIKVRLQDGPNTMEGRVEIFFNGEWGTVCDDGWSIEEAAVVCRQLGNYDVRSAKCCSEYPSKISGTIHLDDVYCQGNERRLELCSHNQWGEHNCGNHENAGVICSDLRIPSTNNQATSNIGPIELLVDGRWGHICAENLTLAAANVTCHQVHNTDVISIQIYESPAIPRISYLDCDGQESMIANCSQGTWVNTSCPSGHIGGVLCHANKVRLVGGSTPREGRVEVNHEGEWGTICDDNFDLPEAEVICRQLGFIGAHTENCCQKFGPGSDQIFLDDLSCVGTEFSIELCGHRGWGSHNCGHHEDAGVICQSNLIPDEDETSGEPPILQSSIRLRGGSSVLSGRVEVLKDGNYGTVCDDGFGLEEATVVCHQLGFAAADPVDCCPSFGGGSGQILLDGLQCRGNEEDLFSCDHTTLHNCEHYEDAGVNCLSQVPGPLPGIPSEGDMRLSDGNALQGRVEIFLNGGWGTVCDDNFDIKDADVICRQLGYKSANPKQCCANFGAGVGDILLDDLECEGSEVNIFNCPHTNRVNHNCGHFEDVGVKCIRSVYLNSTTPLEGRLELRHEGAWIGVCHATFTSKEGKVGCLHAGGLEFKKFKPIVSNKTAIHVQNLSCTGKENSLDDCNNGVQFVNTSCDEVYLICRKRTGPPLRLVDGSHPLEGRVEVFNQGQWGTVCDDGWGVSEAVVACRQLGNYVPAMFQYPARCCGAFGIGTLPILLDNLVCTGAEPSLDQCKHGGWNVNNCGHNEDAGLICTDIRLVGGVVGSVLEGRVEVLQNHRWLTISSENWTKENSAVVCRQLFNTTVASVSEYQIKASPMVTNVHCSGNEKMLSSCDYNSTSLSPKGAKAIGVACSELRLSDGSRAGEGRIEVISLSGEWASFCSHGFTQESGDVACREAGFCFASDIYHDKFGPAPGNIRLSELKCIGNESKLEECPHRQGASQCSNSYFTAGVRCKDTCDNLGSLVNGEVIPMSQSYATGSVVSFKCNPGYILSGSKNIVCESCVWSSKMPVCEMSVVTCPDPPKFANATISTSDSSIVHYRCVDGYHSNQAATYMVCESGKWSGPGIACQEDVAEKADGNDSGFVGSQSPRVSRSYSLLWLMASFLLLILILLVIYDIRKRAYRLHCKPVRFNCAKGKDIEGELQLLNHDVVNQQHESALQEPDTPNSSWPA
ncbi:scavenger receptor cysteine-rich domain superfamily protein-like isoform X2 [Anneissia japonica]|uniref:scavenger receptor cysteine-rich domain superfamily protein-like isoform X2 n=1 Tax=Anneissia japonica TaxID=1529436 RepID=UPI00142577CF|nr:scavenger receptor cysteine-rich domain superfamily protein-like isoform X2 [Anneissia japonica]